jgi:SAM-dependent methyltransferase
MDQRPDTDSILRDVSAYYTDTLRTHGATPRGVDWNSTESQEIRFAQLSRILPESGFSVADLGCGYGSYYDYLSGRHPRFDYVGVDISPEMVQRAGDLHRDAANCRFVRSDRPPGACDYVVASGIFNVRQGVADGQWLPYVLQCIETMDACSRGGFAFNCLTSHSHPEKMRGYLYYADPGVLFEHCLRYSRNVTLLSDYGLYEFTLLVDKERQA